MHPENKRDMISKRNLLIGGLILLAILSRFLPHPPNFAPITAIALFGGAYFTNRSLVWLLPIAIMLISDFFLGFHNTILYVYGTFILIALVGLRLYGNVTMSSVISCSLLGSVLFFIITNLGVWLSGGYYPMTLEGLTTCYVSAIPFFHYTLAGDLVYSGVLFGAAEYSRRQLPELWAEK